MAQDEKRLIEEVTQSEYKYGFVTDIETETSPIAETILFPIKKMNLNGF